jgi:hypothetical protein
MAAFKRFVCAWSLESVACMHPIDAMLSMNCPEITRLAKKALGEIGALCEPEDELINCYVGAYVLVASQESLKEQGLPTRENIHDYVEFCKSMISSFEAQSFDEFRELVPRLLENYRNARKVLLQG